MADEIAILCAELELSVEVREEALDEVATSLSDDKDADALSLLTDQQRKLASIRREIEGAGCNRNHRGPHHVLARMKPVRSFRIGKRHMEIKSNLYAVVSKRCYQIFRFQATRSNSQKRHWCD